MRISAKGRYGLAAMTDLSRSYGSGEYTTVISISTRLGISKIYLEQVFSLLKRSGLVLSIKGAQGGYQLARTPDKISALDVLEAVEQSLFEKTEDSVQEKAPDVEMSMQKIVFGPLDEVVRQALGRVSLLDLATQTQSYQDGGFMFYI